MILLIHKIAGILLFISHSIFLFRSAVLLRKGLPPSKGDRLFMSLSQVILPFAIISGFIMIGRVSVYHLIPGIMPLIMMFILSRRSVRKRQPLLLPLINWIFITAALLTGVLL
ncbi:MULTISPECIES: hypothetical protein [unclassified Oceanispirochaeta]|uniref:hypothetical protein n=1 Tax=unclassified Oceanispirochaeta TaxID=2635722 RepID=UPI000E08D92F|nr:MULTISPECIES: hypothetical protein [unclassified Oceanispirochaeta]MBF9018446.1 hypothetical protein [Oceanispirochaeta sp. M2]NPD73898.1 hypothetical protein [Oceanispirochaeta sp. M1]RDG30357.1 hypothetical protein DV872_17520 [Oceanispirochaeta sp. M1]